MIDNDSFLSTTNEVFGQFIPDYLLIKVSERVANETNMQMSYSRTFIHEFVHWLQFAGTNWGFMQLIISQEPINSLNNQLQFSDLKPYLKGFKELSLNAHYQVKIPPEYQATAGIFYQNWQDSFITKKIFSSSTNKPLQIANANRSVAVALCDYTNTTNILLGNEVENINDLESLFTYPVLAGLRVDTSEDFTTFDLLEGHAKINEVLHEISLQVSGNGVVDIDFSKFIKGEYPNVYSKAFKFYCRTAGKEFSFDENFEIYPFIEECIKFAVIVDASLAITIPPFVPKRIYKWIDWSNIYPPIRFNNLCIAATSTPFEFNNTLNKESYENYVALICKKANYANPVDQVNYFLEYNEEGLQELENRLNIENLRVENMQGITDYLLFLAVKFNRLRQKTPEVLCLPGWGDVGAGLLELKWDEAYYWLHCPFEVRGETFYNRLPPSISGLSGYLIGMIVVNKILEQHVIRNMPLKSIVFPFELDAKLKAFAKEIIKSKFDINIIWE